MSMSKDRLRRIVFELGKVPDRDKELELIIRQLEREIKPIKVRSAKNKGKNLQNRVCELISKFTGIPWGNKDEFLIQSRPMGQHGVDVILLGEARKLFPFSIECKSVESFSLAATVAQAIANTKAGDDWMIVHKSSKLVKPVVIMDFETFLTHYFKEKV